MFAKICALWKRGRQLSSIENAWAIEESFDPNTWAPPGDELWIYDDRGSGQWVHKINRSVLSNAIDAHGGTGELRVSNHR